MLPTWPHFFTPRVFLYSTYIQALAIQRSLYNLTVLKFSINQTQIMVVKCMDIRDLPDMYVLSPRAETNYYVLYCSHSNNTSSLNPTSNCHTCS